MPLTRLIVVALTVTVISALAACGGGSTFNVQDPPPPPAQNVSISFQTSPPTGIPINGGAPLTATVTNDPTNAGVTWSLVLVCQGPNCGAQPCAALKQATNPCGTLQNSSGELVAHSNSGDTITYHPPSIFPVPGNIMNVQVVAYATADENQNVLAPLSITAFGNVLNGTYVFQAQGSDLNAQPYQIAGSIVLDGNGNITSGQQTFNTVSQGSVTVTSAQANLADPNGGNYFAGSSYFIGTDGRGTITLNNMTDQNGVLVAEAFSLVVLSSSQALIAHIGDELLPLPTPPALEAYSGTGTLELQTGTAVPAGSLAFVGSGTDTTAVPIAYGGVVTIGANGILDETHSLVNSEYPNNADFYIECDYGVGVNGSLAPGTLPGTVILTVNAPNCFPNTVQLTGYMVDSGPNPARIRFIETDDTAGSGLLTAGLAIGQVPPAGGFSNGSFGSSSGQPYVFGAPGMDPSGFSGSLTSADAITATANPDPTQPGAISGYTDTFFQSLTSLQSQGQISDQFTADYTIDDHPLGRIKVYQFLFANRHFPTFTPITTFYLTGNQTTALVLYGAAGSYGPSVGVGIAYPQQQPASALAFGNGESYGFGFAQQNGSGLDVGSGQMTANQSGSGGTLTGTVDDISDNAFLKNGTSSSPPLPVSDTFTCGTSTCANNFGLIPGTFTTGQLTGANANYYLIDQDHGYFIETDLANPGTGTVALGYFAKGCDVTVTNQCQQAEAKPSRRHASKSHRANGLPKHSALPQAQSGRGF